jgi:AcrR family transcriptional regulator
MGGLREKKAARTRIGILDAAMELAGQGPPEAVPVDAICDRVGISTVTFFNYFPRRETLTLFFAWTRWLAATVELRASPLKGAAAIRRTFRRAAELFAERPGFTLGFVGFVTRMGSVRDELPRFEPTSAEKRMLHPDVEGIEDLEILRLDRQWVRHIQEAVAVGELPSATEPGQMVMVLGSILYGMPVMAVVGRLEAVDGLYDLALDRLFEPAVAPHEEV